MFRFILPKMIMKVERWKWNKEFRIYVSNMGNFKDEHKNNMPVYTGNNGYLSVKTPYGYKLAHRLVMLTWRPIPNAEELTVDHLNHNKRDNSIYNLEWVSKQENWERAMRDLIPVEQNSVTVNKGDSKKNPLMFDNVDEAFAWLIQNDTAMRNQPNLNAERVKRKLMLASTSKEKYANKFWCIKK